MALMVHNPEIPQMHPDVPQYSLLEYLETVMIAEKSSGWASRGLGKHDEHRSGKLSRLDRLCAGAGDERQDDSQVRPHAASISAADPRQSDRVALLGTGGDQIDQRRP